MLLAPVFDSNSVHRAILKNTSLMFAIKEVSVGRIESATSIKKEIELLKSTVHENTVRYFGCYSVLDTIWILTEYCAAGSILDCIHLTNLTFSELQVSIVLESALNGLQYLHNNNVIHRDVKAANLLLTSNAIVKIADFGVSSQLTQSICVRNSVVVTPYW